MCCLKWTSHWVSHIRLRIQCDIALRNSFSQNKSTIVVSTVYTLYIYIQFWGSIISILLNVFLYFIYVLLFLSEQQFFRCLWQTLGLKLDCEQETYIRQKYDFLRNGRLNYKQFCEEIDRNFNPNDLTRDPAVQRVAAPEL